MTRGADRVERLDSQYFGKYRGVVIANDDPQQLGRLRLWVPSLFPTDDGSTPGEDDPTVTDWAWPCLPFGGKPDQGMFFVPEVKAKVWVEYEEGNLDSPIWVGVFWSAPGGSTEIPTEAKDMDNNEPQRRVLRTSSGHVLEFCDIDGKESITLRHKDGATLTLDENGSATLGNKEGTFLYLNAQDSEFSFADKNGNNVRLGDTNVTLTNASGTVVDIADKAVQIIAKNVMLRSDTVQLGEGAMEPAILGRTFAAIFDAHTHPTALGPSGPPIPAPMPLSAPTNPAMSKSVTIK
ncbi:MAG: phage baseplate assembly protein V [Gemmatimonadaceae bacterium]